MSYFQMPRSQNKTQDETIEQYASSRNQKPVVLGPKIINLVNPQDKDFRIAIMNMLKDVKEDI